MPLPCAETARDLLAHAVLARNLGRDDLSAFWPSPKGWRRVRFDGATVGQALAGMRVVPCAAPDNADAPGPDTRVTLLRDRMEPDLPLAALHALDDAEWQAVVHAPNQTAQPLPGPSLAALFVKAARDWPDHIAIDDAGQVLDYRTLHDRAARIAAYLRDAGIVPGEAVGIFANRGTDAVVAIVGAVLAGAVYVPMSPDWPQARVSQLAAAAGVRVTLCAAHAQLPGALPLDAAMAHPRLHSDPSERGADDPAYILFTSGSTGVPKGVRVPHRGVIRLVMDRDLHPIAPGQSVMHAAPLSFDASTKEIWLPLLHGGRITVLQREDVLSARAFAATRGRIDFAFLTTALFQTLVEQDATCLAGIAHIYTGGEVTRPESLAAALAVPGIGRVLHCYGPTETTVYAMAQRMQPGGDVTLGHPIANTTAYVLDADLRPVPPGHVGEICIGGAGVALGYLDDPERTARHFVPCPPHLGTGMLYRTGDRGAWLADGRIVFHGRTDTQIKLRGHRIELAEIEAAILRQPGVLAAVVRTHQPDQAEARLIAWLRIQPPADTDALRAELAKALPDYMRPAWLIAVPDFPLTPHGKIDHARLPRPQAVPAALDDPADALLDMLRQALIQPGFTAQDSFVAQGGTSLMAVRLTQSIAARWQVTLPVSLFFQDRTAARLGQMLDIALQSRAAPTTRTMTRI